MAHSHQTHILGEIAIPESWLWDDQLTDLIHLAKDLTIWTINLNGIMTDMINHTSPTIVEVAALWKEAFININSICLAWIKVIVEKMESSLWQMRIDNFTSRFSALGKANFASAVKSLKAEYKSLRHDLGDFWHTMDKYVQNVPQYARWTTSRPAIEILFNAILLTRAAQSDSPKSALESMGGHWLHSSPTFAVPHSFGVADIRGDSPIGTPHCVAALFTGTHLSTGSTLVQYGESISQLLVTSEGEVSKLSTYHRSMRQRRYSERDQSILNVHVNKAVDWLKIETLRLQKQAQNKGKTQAQVRAVAARNMENNARSIRAPCLKHEDKYQVGQAFQGKSLAFKRKCPFCTTLYSYSVAVLGSVPWVEVDWNMLPEADENRPRDARGCCAEAQTFIQGLHHRQSGFVRRLENELGLTYKQ